MEDGPTRTDQMAMTGSNNDNEKILRRCACGWEKVTSSRGLRIHQGKMKCLRQVDQQHRTAQEAGQTTGSRSQECNHSAAGPSGAESPEVVERNPMMEKVPCDHEDTSPPEAHLIKPVTKQPGRREKIKWPKANDRVAWQRLDADVSQLLELALRGSIESKLNIMGDIIFEVCRERFGEVSKKEPTAPGKGRREREIEQLIKARRQLRRNWRKATSQEKEGLKVLWDEVRQNLARLRRVERIRRRRKRREKERTNFFRDPFKYARQMLDEKRSGKLNVSKEELEQHIKSQYSDSKRTSHLGSPGYVPRPAPPTLPYNSSPPKLREVEEVIRKARSASAPGPNGLPYKLYKNCPQVVKALWKLMKTAWRKQQVPAEWPSVYLFPRSRTPRPSASSEALPC